MEDRLSQADLAATSQALATARDTVVAASANLERRLSGMSREIVRVPHDVLPSGSAVRTASKVVEATSVTVGQVKEGLQASRLLIDRERREVEALRHEHTIMFAKHCQIYYPEAHPRIRRPTVEPALPAGMHYVDVSHLPLRPDDLDIDSGREEDRGVCHLVAPLAAFAHRRRELLLNCVRLDRGKIVVTVPGGQYRLEPTLPASDETGALTGIGMTGGHTLMAFVEKAFASKHGGYERVGAGMSPNQAMSGLGGRRTGRPSAAEHVHSSHVTSVSWPLRRGLGRCSNGAVITGIVK